MKNLLVTAAANTKWQADEMPKLFSLASDGLMYCLESIIGLDLDMFDNIYISILASHNDNFYLSDLLNVQFKRLNLINKAKVIILDKPTKNQPETIYRSIIQENIQGSIFCKDGDSFFKCEIPQENTIAVYTLDEMKMVNPQHKSYVAVDDMYYVTNIIEKKILGNMFSAGGYFFESVETYKEYYLRLNKYENLYLSHVIYSMLLDGKTFRPIKVTNYIDWDI